MPEPAEIRHAVRVAGWRGIRLNGDRVEKLDTAAGIDVGGIAKGYAVDLAIETMRSAGLAGGMVQCGGETRVFGRPRKGELWRIGLRNPFGDESDRSWGTLELREGAVSTSGNYERYFLIQGRRYNHIVDPRTGRPVDSIPQVTVVADRAVVSDGWSTALTVLGVAGLRQAESDGVEAMLVVGSSDKHEIRRTPGFAKFLGSE